MRAPKGSLFAQDAYTYFAGTDDAGAATWSGNPAAAVAIFQDPNGLDGPEIVWDAPLGRDFPLDRLPHQRRQGRRLRVGDHVGRLVDARLRD